MTDHHELERLLAEYGASSMRLARGAVAAAGECPQPQEVVALERGEVVDVRSREALAQHLIDCPRCFESSLVALSGQGSGERAGVANSTMSTARDAGFAVSPAGRSGRRWSIRIAALAAAALLMLSAFALIEFAGEPGARAPGLAGMFLADAIGLEMRSAPAEARRAVVLVEKDGVVSLGRFMHGELRIEEVEGAATSVAVTAGEEVVLPLDRALLVDGPQTWMVLHRSGSASSLDAEVDLESLFRDAARGRHPAGISSRRLALRP